MIAVDLIAKHIQPTGLVIEECEAVCAFSGVKLTKGIPVKIAIKDTFTDRAYLRYKSEFISPEVYVCMGRIEWNGRNDFELRKYSFLATNSDFKILQRDECLSLLLSPPDPPFVLSITESNKKHRAFKARVNLSREIYSVMTDTMNVIIPLDEISVAAQIAQRWYSIIPDKRETAAQPTWFTKDEIQHGSMNFKKIEEYGINRYFTENQELERFRKQSYFSLLTFCLNKL